MSSAHDALVAASMAVSFNPLVSAVASPVIAALAARSPRRHSLLGLPGVLLLAAWLVGDGLEVASWARDVLPDAVPRSAAVAALVVWALGALAIGYVLPVWAGAFVGRRVTHGTGWASAAAIALLASGTLSALGALA